MSEFYTLVGATMALDLFILVFLVWAFHSPRYAEQRLSHAPTMKVPRAKRLKNIVFTSIMSFAGTVGLTYVLWHALFHARPTAWWVIGLQAVGVLLTYDFIYYFFHRGMHHKKVMRWVHGVHHRAKNPSAMESFFLHPAELVGGLLLFIGSVWIVGPIHVYAFGLAFLFYSTLNLFVHSGIQFGTPLLAPINFLTRKHFVHHMKDFKKNYSSLTPLPDLVFGTSG